MKLSEAKQWAELLARAAKGETLQYIFHGSVWVDLPKTTTHITTDEVNDYRIKLEPTLRPWKPEEVPSAGFLIRWEENSCINGTYLVIATDLTGFVTSNTPDTSNPTLIKNGWKDVFNRAEHSLDHGVTWKPCGVVE
jgi:hypothetical protein